MELLEQVADTVVGWQRKRKVAAQVNEIGSTDGTRPFFPEIVGKLLQALGNIGSHDALFLNVLGTPSGVFAFAVKLSVLQSHCTSQSDGAPVAPAALQQNFGRGSKPSATLGRINQGYEHTRIELAGTVKEFYWVDGL